MVNERVHVLDAWALLAMLLKEEPAAARVRQVIQEAHEDTHALLYVSIINLGEVFYRIGRDQGNEAAVKTISDLRQLGLIVLSATDDRVMAAARLKMAHPLSYADAFAVAASKEVNGTLLTGDPEIVELREQFRIEVLIRDA